MEQLLTTREIAELLQVPEGTLHQWRYRINDLEGWLDEQAQKQTT